MNTERLETPADAYDRRVEELVDKRGYSYDDARRELGMDRPEDEDTSPEKKGEPKATVPLGVKAVEVSARVQTPKTTLKPVESPADWRPSSRGVAVGAQHGDSEADGGTPAYFEQYNPATDAQRAEGIRRGMKTIAPVLQEINARVAAKKQQTTRDK